VTGHRRQAIIAAMAGVGPVATACRTERTQPRREQAVGRLAAGQHGVVSLSQLRSLGLSASAVRSRVAAGRLHRLHRGVYAVGHPVLTIEGRWLAAVLACGPDAVLSHRSAAALWDLRPSARTAIDVSTPSRAGRSRAGIDVHRAGALRPADTTRTRGVPCTTVARTLLDLAGVIDRRALGRACERAELLRILDAQGLHDVLARAMGRRGAPVLRAILTGEQLSQPPTRSELEERFLALCTAAGVPRPRANAWMDLDGAAIEVDFIWPAHGLIAETDGYTTHGTRRAFERDRQRDQRLLLAGWRVVRFTWRQITQEPARVADTLQALLAQPQRSRHATT
jgi:predicted transcriptional regulator of viral defense system